MFKPEQILLVQNFLCKAGFQNEAPKDCWTAHSQGAYQGYLISKGVQFPHYTQMPINEEMLTDEIKNVMKGIEIEIVEEVEQVLENFVANQAAVNNPSLKVYGKVSTVPTTPVVSEASPVVDNSTVAPVADTTAVPVADTTAVPVVDTVAPVVDTVAPVVDTVVAPVVDTVVAPVVNTVDNSTVAPVADTTAVPVADTVVAPVADTTAVPVVNTVDNSTVAPVADTTAVPVVNTVDNSTVAPVDNSVVIETVDNNTPQS